MDNEYVASWIKIKPAKQTPIEQYLAALYHCGEAAQ